MKIVVGGIDITNLRKKKESHTKPTKEEAARYQSEIKAGKCHTDLGVFRFRRSIALSGDDGSKDS